MTEQAALEPEALEELKTSNRLKWDAMQAKGATIDPAAILSLRMDSFLETLDEFQRVVFESIFEKNMEIILDEATIEVNKQLLTQNIPGQKPGGSKLFVPGQ